MTTTEYKKRTECASCGNTDLYEIIGFGNLPLAGCFPKQEERTSIKRYPLSLVICEQCHLVQTDSVISADVLFKDYRYLSSIGLTPYFTSVAEMYKKRFGLTGESNILEIGCNDGVLLEPLMNLGLNPVGIDPAENVTKVAGGRGCCVVTDYFDSITAKEHFQQDSQHLVIANNCFAHIDDIHSVIEGVKWVLRDDGQFVIEVHYLKNLIEGLQYDFIYQEHLYYYTLSALVNLFRSHGMTVVDVEDTPVHSGSIRVYVAKGITDLPASVTARIREEETEGLTSILGLKTFRERVLEHLRSLKNLLKTCKENGKKVVGYGASGRGNMLVNVCGITQDLVNYVVDESPERVNRFIGGVNIPVVEKSVLDTDSPDYVVMFAWNYYPTIDAKFPNRRFKWIIPFPKPYVS
jgi:methylation protein EvaC